MTHLVGFVVNPVAGLGGRVGLKGSDGVETQRRALTLGATPAAQGRAQLAADELAVLPDTRLLTWGGPMGASVAMAANADARVLGVPEGHATGPDDTHRAVTAMADAGADILVFVGGDGTARDVLDAIGTRLPVIGLPAGVKMYAGVFAPHPLTVARTVERFLRDPQRATVRREVLDIDEAQLRAGVVTTAFYGELAVPRAPRATQGMKAPTPSDAACAAEQIARAVAAVLGPQPTVVLGPGSTVAAVGAAVGCGSTLLGVDVVVDGHRAVIDGDERAILAAIDDVDVDALIVSPIGGQGFILGRGNQQLSPRVLWSAGPGALLVVATQAKITELRGRPLLVDTGDDRLDRALSGTSRIQIGPEQQIAYPVKAASG